MQNVNIHMITCMSELLKIAEIFFLASTLCHLNVHRMPSPVSCSRARSWPPIQHHNSSERPTLAAGQAPHHLLKSQFWYSKLFIVAVHRTMLTPFSSTDSHRQFRSTTTRAAAIQRTRTQFGRRAFSVCGPDVWNSLPPSVRTVDSNSSFRRVLKTHLFQLVFNN